MLLFVYLREGERENENGSGGEAEREERISSRLCAVSTEPDAELELTLRS